MKANRKAKRIARELFRLCLVDGVLDHGRARLITERLLASGRRGALPVVSGFQRLVRLDLARHTATVESATPLGGTLRNEIRTGLAKKYGADLETTFEENPSLIGGVRIKVGSDVYDGSIRAKLSALEAEL